MTSRGVWVHAGLLAGALGFAYHTWTRPRDEEGASKREDRPVVVWEGRADEVKSVELFSEKKHAKVERRSGKSKDDDYFWVTTERELARPIAPPKPADPNAKEGAQAEPAPPPPTPEKTKKSFMAGKTAEELFSALAPLRALRALGKPNEEKKKDYGLDEPKDRLVVAIGSQQRELKLGGRVYGGSDRYALDAKSGEAFVLGGDVVRDLEAADSRLMERELHGFKSEEVASAVARRGRQKRDLVAGGTDAKSRFWADTAKPSQKDETASNWMAKLDRLKVQEYVDDATKPDSVPETILRVDYRRKGGAELGYLELSRLPGEKDKFEYFARTEHTRGLVKVSQYLGEQVDEDADAVMGK